MAETESALILDFGGVITRTLFETHRATEEALGLPAGSLAWEGPFNPDGDPLWRAMQADEITERDYWMARTREVGAMIGRNWTKMSDLLIASRGDAPPEIIRSEFLDALGRAKAAGVKMAILSNELDLFYGPAFRQKLGFMDDFDAVHDATYTKTLKPDPRAYAAVLAELGLPPQVCVFVDDQKRNVDGAALAGMKTVHFDVTDPRESFARALRLLGLD